MLVVVVEALVVEEMELIMVLDLLDQLILEVEEVQMEALVQKVVDNQV
jgi:hypothetical protein